MSVWRQTGIKPKELDEILEMPDCFAECWNWFLRLNSRRTNTGMGINPITYSDMKAFFEFEQYYPMSWEVAMIEQFDNAFLNHVQDKMKKEQESSKSKVRTK